MAEDIAINGQVRSYEGAPLAMIKVSMYRNTMLLTSVYSDDDGEDSGRRCRMANRLRSVSTRIQRSTTRGTGILRHSEP